MQPELQTKKNKKMKSKEFVAFDTAKSLKKYGYPQVKESGCMVYPTEGEFKGELSTYNLSASERDKSSIIAPSIVEAVEWLENTKHILVNIHWCETENQVRWKVVAKEIDDYFMYTPFNTFSSREEAWNYAISYGLTKCK